MFRFAIDRGGTFTDVYAECPDGSTRVMKLLSEDPENYQDAPREAIRRILQEVCHTLLFEIKSQIRGSSHKGYLGIREPTPLVKGLV